jgi:sporulation protein YlmC with PRC-barrel domain
MKPGDPIKLVSELLDLPLLDDEGRYCGIVDDIDLGAGPKPELKALLVGPGAYDGRLPRWMMWLAKRIAGDRVTRVPIEEVRTINNAVHLKRPASDLGLHKSESAAGEWIPHKGAL